MLKQVLYEMRHQPLVSWLTISGTALALFLVMTTYMLANMHTVNVAPETERPRIFYGKYLHVDMNPGETSGSMSYDMARELYSGLDGVEKESYIEDGTNVKALQVGDDIPLDAEVRSVDDAYFQIYDYTFVEGSPFDREIAESGAKNILLSRSTAEKLFGKGDRYVGRKLKIDNIEHTVSGIYTDVNPILFETMADAFVPASPAIQRSWEWSDYFGSTEVVLLTAPGTTREQLASQVEKRYKAFKSRIADTGRSAYYHSTPYDTKLMYGNSISSNNTPVENEGETKRLITYIILLLLPAINLSSLTRSRMKTRVEEIGVRRAFGCTRLSVMSQMMTENLIFSLIGAAIGLLFSFLFIVFGSKFFISFGSWGMTEAQAAATPSFSMLFSWSAFLFALLFCFVLNLLSASIPAWKASGVHPAEALSGHGAVR